MIHCRETNTKSVADLTRIVIGEGVLWLASVRDAFANQVIGWHSGPRATTEMVVSPLLSRDVWAGQLIHHSAQHPDSPVRRGVLNAKSFRLIVRCAMSPAKGRTGDTHLSIESGHECMLGKIEVSDEELGECKAVVREHFANAGMMLDASLECTYEYEKEVLGEAVGAGAMPRVPGVRPWRPRRIGQVVMEIFAPE